MQLGVDVGTWQHVASGGATSVLPGQYAGHAATVLGLFAKYGRQPTGDELGRFVSRAQNTSWDAIESQIQTLVVGPPPAASPPAPGDAIVTSTVAPNRRWIIGAVVVAALVWFFFLRKK